MAFNLNRFFDSRFRAWRESFEVSLIRQHVQPGDVVLAASGEIGFYARLFTELVGASGRVHCLEPDAEHYAQLDRDTRPHPNIFVEKATVGAESCRVSPPFPDPGEQPELMLKIDDYMLKTGPRLDFIKLDIGGAEADALCGMPATLAINPAIKMICGFCPRDLRDAGSSACEFFASLHSLAFDVQLLGPDRLEPLDLAKARLMDSANDGARFAIFATRAKI